MSSVKVIRRRPGRYLRWTVMTVTAIRGPLQPGGGGGRVGLRLLIILGLCAICLRHGAHVAIIIMYNSGLPPLLGQERRCLCSRGDARWPR